MILVILFLFLVPNINAQDNSDLVTVGDILVINQPSGTDFKHIFFPKKNFVIKRGGIADMKSIYGKKVVVSNVKTKDNGSIEVILKPKDGRKFFKALPSVKADLKNALIQGELKTPVEKKEDSIAQK
ncbi:MAG: hypothetical protein WBG90_20400 [Saonia sp.]